MKTKQSYSILILVGVLFWMIAILLGYYLFHKPLTPQTALIWLKSLSSLIVGFWILSLSAALGKKLLIWFGFGIMQNLAIPAALGMGVFSLIVLLLGVLSFQFQILLILLFIIPTVFLWRYGLDWWKQFFIELKAVSTGRGILRWFVVAILLLVGISLLIALAPPIHYDALTYHLALPRQYLNSGGITPQTGWIRSGMPQTGEMIYTWALASGNDSAPAVTGWLFAFVALLGFISFMGNKISLKAGLAGVLALLGGASISGSMGWGYIDWFCLLFGFCATICLSKYLESGDTKFAWLIGIFCGLSFAAKYTGGVLLIGIVLWLEIDALRKKNRIIGDILAILGGFFITALPWMTKNWIFTGNPLAPFGIPLINEPNSHQAMMKIAIPFGNWFDILLLPIRASILGVEGGVGYSHDIGPLLIMFAVLSLLPNKLPEVSRRFARAAGVISVVIIILWVIGNQLDALLVQSRLYYAAFPLFAILAGIGYQALSEVTIPGIRLERIANVVILLVSLLTIVGLWNDLQKKVVLPYLNGNVSRNEFTTHNLGWYDTAVNDIHASHQQTLMLYEPRPYTCIPDCQPDEILDRWHTDLLEYGSCAVIQESWIAEGFSSVLVNSAGVRFFTTANDPHHTLSDLSALENCLQSLPVKQIYGDSYTLYGLEK